jgi:hypothetical protein
MGRRGEAGCIHRLWAVRFGPLVRFLSKIRKLIATEISVVAYSSGIRPRVVNLCR